MIKLSDIRGDLSSGDRSGLRDAFRALVSWPDEAEIEGGTPQDRKEALEAVSKALEGDQAILPRKTAEMIFDATDEPVTTYGEGADAVLARFAYFAKRLNSAD